MSLDFVDVAGIDVFSEWRAFFAAHPDAAADALAVLEQIATAGLDGLSPGIRDGLGMSRPYSYQSAGWWLFFEVQGPYSGPCKVVLLLVVDFGQMSIDPATIEAKRRRDWRA